MAPERGLELADVFARHGTEAIERFGFSAHQRTVMSRVQACRSATLGGHLHVCDHCGDAKPAYNSCRDRHCPKCLATSQARWLTARLARILPVPHFHVVFTLPGLLRPLVRTNRRQLLGLFFRTVADTLKAFATDERWLGAQPGFTAVLHTWTRDLRFHPHIHCVVTAGGLSHDGTRWNKPARGANFLAPVNALAKVFRARFLEGLKSLYDDDMLYLDGPCGRLRRPRHFRARLDRLHRMRWNVYVKRPFAGAKHVFSYLGQYTHRVAISNHRLRKLDDKGVHFSTKDGSVACLEPTEFIRRFLDHLMPKRFVRIRHYGLYSPACVRGRLELARAQLPPAPESAPLSAEQARAIDFRALIIALTGQDPLLCTVCGIGTMVRSEPIAPVPLAPTSHLCRGPPR